jgi:hypothetical protein
MAPAVLAEARFIFRNESQPRALREIAWRAQLRLCQRYRRLNARGLPLNKICTAMARELAGFIWDLARQATAATGNATREHDEGNPRPFYVGIQAMLPDARQRQPRDVPMQCGNQPANIRVIHRRHTASRVAFPVESAEAKVISSRRDIARIPLAPVDTRGPYQKG